MVKKEKMVVINAKDVMINCMSESEQQVALTGILNVDSRMIMSKRSFTLVAGVSGSGKTDYLLNIAKNNAVKGKRVLFINLKNGVEELSVRLMLIKSHVSFQKIVQKRMTEQEWEQVINSVDLVIIDDIQMVEDEGNRFVKERMDYVLKNIKAIAVQLSVPVIGAYCISSKEIEKRVDHRPLLSDLEYNGLLTYPDNIQDDIKSAMSY